MTVSTNERDLTKYAIAIQQLEQGRLNVSGLCVLQAGTTTTAVTAANCGANSQVILTARTADAAAALATRRGRQDQGRDHGRHRAQALMVALAALTAANARRWAVARMLTDRGAAFRAVARRLVAAKERYQAVAAKTGVPWFVIAVIHEREASQRWDASLAQGDPWAKVSTHVPKGRGPFSSWEAAAIDALVNCAPYAAKWRDWSPGGLLTLLEQYNGLGYANMGRPSPYVWAGTDQYARGKYVADGKYDPNVIDVQLGCAGLLLAMAEIDASVAAGLGKAVLAPPIAPTAAPPASPAKPSITNPAPGSLGAWIKSFFTSFKKA